MSQWPRITLVTPSFNQGEYLEATLDSVLSQGYPNLQYIVVDGGSKDASIDIIKRNARHLAWWTSEADQGQADAISKGFARADGALLNWLNSDDCLRPHALAAIAECWRETSADIIVGRDQPIDAKGVDSGPTFVPTGYRYPECLRFWNGQFRYHQPPTFLSRRAFDAAGGLDTRLHFAMDYDLYCRMLRLEGVRVATIPATLSAFRIHAEAKTSSRRERFLDELSDISRRLWPGDWDLESESRAMDRYCAECSAMNAVDLFRNGELRRGFAAAGRALQGDSWHAVKFVARRALIPRNSGRPK